MREGLNGSPNLRFGVFEVDPRTGELYKGGVRIKLQEQPLKVLLTLLEQSGKVVTREELRKRIWPEESFGDFDHAVNVAVAKLRTALCDSADVPRFVETVHRRGYRFIAPVDGRSRLEPDSRSLLGKLLTNGVHSLGRIYRNVFATLVILALMVVGFFYLHRGHGPKLTDKDTVMLSDFVNTTSEPVFDGALKQALASELQQSPFLNIFLKKALDKPLHTCSAHKMTT